MPTPGKIQIFMSTPWELQALFYNFEVNSAELKPEHLSWIRTTVGVHILTKGQTARSPQRTREMTATIVGLASRAGDDASNFRLSKARAENVSDAISLLDPGSLLSERKVAVGEEAARLLRFKDGVEHEKWRGVYIRLYDPSKVPNYGPSADRPLPKWNNNLLQIYDAGAKTKIWHGDLFEKKDEASVSLGVKSRRELREELTKLVADGITFSRVVFQTHGRPGIIKIGDDPIPYF